MKLYQLHVEPEDSAPEGESADEWFTSLTAAKRRRAALIREKRQLHAEHKAEYLEDFEFWEGGELHGTDYQIDRVILDAPSRALVLRLLNGRGFVRSSECVVPAHRWDPS
jgi:hypothetical protein